MKTYSRFLLLVLIACSACDKSSEQNLATPKPETAATEKLPEPQTTKTTTQITSDLGEYWKGKSFVKEYFDRKPDAVDGPNVWYYEGQFYDPASEHTFTKVRIEFQHEQVIKNVSFK